MNGKKQSKKKKWKCKRGHTEYCWMCYYCAKKMAKETGFIAIPKIGG